MLDGAISLPIFELTILLYALLIALLIVGIKILKVLKSFQTPPAPTDPIYEKEHADPLSFDDFKK